MPPGKIEFALLGWKTQRSDQRGDERHQRVVVGLSYPRYRVGPGGAAFRPARPPVGTCRAPPSPWSGLARLPRPVAGGQARHKAGPAGGAPGLGEGGVGLID